MQESEIREKVREAQTALNSVINKRVKEQRAFDVINYLASSLGDASIDRSADKIRYAIGEIYRLGVIRGVNLDATYLPLVPNDSSLYTDKKQVNDYFDKISLKSTLEHLTSLGKRKNKTRILKSLSKKLKITLEKLVKQMADSSETDAILRDLPYALGKVYKFAQDSGVRLNPDFKTLIPSNSSFFGKQEPSKKTLRPHVIDWAKGLLSKL